MRSSERRVPGLLSGLMHWLFASSAMLTIIALGMIVFLLFRESFSFFPEYRKSIASYRQSGLEYVDLLAQRHDRFIQIDHQLIELRADWIRQLERRGVHGERLQQTLHEGPAARLFRDYRATAEPLRAYLEEKRMLAIGWKQNPATRPSAAKVAQTLREDLAAYQIILRGQKAVTEKLFSAAVSAKTTSQALDRGIARLAFVNTGFHQDIDRHLNDLAAWDAGKPVEKGHALAAFFFGDQWITASEQQNWYGLLPLLTGSLLVGAIAVFIAVPVGIGSAVYVNLLAGPREQSILKPSLEFISALPAVVVGFFGVMVFGEFLRMLSLTPALNWLPFFDIQERLNAFTAGALLALMAIPTIFTLAEDALFAVRSELKAASFAMGATPLQTAFRVVIPTALPGIASAVLLGFGRVIGETMIVLLCAGNRVRIPDFAEGLSAAFDPVHTMTGMIAQEMGEVVSGNLHYRALFMVGLVLFIISLIINYAAQTLAEKHRDTQLRYRR